MLQNVPHQIVQSPARLGLPNPNSPSLPNPNPPKFSSHLPPPHNPNQPSNLLTTSSTLLPLLPPLSKAHSILLHMASLASRLFEVSPNRSHWLSAFRGSLPTFLSSQTQSSTSTKEILALLTSLQTQLFEAVAELQEILDLQDAKQKLTREVRSKDSTMLSFATKLKEAQRVLDLLIDDYSDYRRPKRSKLGEDSDDSCLKTVSSQLKVFDILSCAHRISYTTFAGALPPAPQEEQLRASQLYAFADLDIGLPKAGPTENIIEPLTEALPTQPEVSNPLGSFQKFPQIQVPSGWKIGMPVELPSDLPPVDDIHVPNRAEEQQPHPMRGVLKAPDPIQVRPVTDLDLDDDSSEYTSDTESSDGSD